LGGQSRTRGKGSGGVGKEYRMRPNKSLDELTKEEVWDEAEWQTAEIIIAAAILRGHDDFADAIRKQFKSDKMRLRSKLYPPAKNEIKP
jgi:hypothetical protein